MSFIKKILTFIAPAIYADFRLFYTASFIKFALGCQICEWLAAFFTVWITGSCANALAANTSSASETKKRNTLMESP